MINQQHLKWRRDGDMHQADVCAAHALQEIPGHQVAHAVADDDRLRAMTLMGPHVREPQVLVIDEWWRSGVPIWYGEMYLISMCRGTAEIARPVTDQRSWRGCHQDNL